MTRSGTSTLWLGTLASSNLTRYGTYNILYMAVKEDGLPGVDLISTPVVRSLRVVDPNPPSRVGNSWVLY